MKRIDSKEGVIVSVKMAKTAVVSCESFKEHPIYKKKYRVTHKHMAHNEQDFKLGDKVVIKSCRPMSKNKRWVIVGKAGK